MKWIIFLLAIFALSSCNMQRYCSNRFPPTESVDTLTVRDTIIKPVYVEIKLPADTLLLTDTIYLPHPESSPEGFIHTLENEYAVSLCGWEFDRLVHELQMKEAVVSDTVYVELFNDTHYITLDRIHEVKVTPWWVNPLIIILVLIIGVLVVNVVLRR